MPQTGLLKQQKLDSFQFWGLEVKAQGVGRVGFTLRLLSLASRLQFSSVTQSCLTLCDPMDCSTPGFPVHHQLSELTQTHVHEVGDAIQPSHPLSSPSPPTFSLSQQQSFPMNQFFTSGGQSIGVSSSASVLSMNIQD